MNPPGSSGLLSSGPWNHVEAHDTAENHNTRSGDVGKRLPGHEYFEDVNGFWHVGLWHIFPNGEQILMGVKAKVSQLDGSIALGGYYRGEPGSDPDKTQHPLFRIVPEMNVQQVLLPFEVSKAAGEGVIDKSISIRAYLMQKEHERQFILSTAQAGTGMLESREADLIDPQLLEQDTARQTSNQASANKGKGPGHYFSF